MKPVCAKFWPHFEKQMFENHKGALNLKIFQVASSNLYKSYMARKVSLIVIFSLVVNTKWPQYHMFNVKWGYLVKKTLYLP